MIRPKFVPPAARKVSPREIVQILGNPDQVGYPASMNTDACLGYSVMGYQSWDVVYDHCEAWKWTLVRLEGRLSKGRDAKAKDGICQKAKVGYCPCCTRATHVAIPQSYAIGAMDPLKQMGIRLWTAFGPWAPRRLAAIDNSMRYSNSYPLPTGWDWAAKALDFSAPGPILRGIPGGEPIVIQTVAQTKASNVTRPMSQPPEKQKKSADPPVAQTTLAATIRPMLKLLEELKNAGTTTAPLVETPMLQPKLPLDSLTQTTAPSSNSDPRWAGRPRPAVQAPHSQSSSNHERGNEAPPRSNLIRQPHWWGLRRRNNRPPATSPGRHKESPAADSSGSSDSQGRRDWSEWKK